MAESDFKKIRDLLSPILDRAQQPDSNFQTLLKDAREVYVECGRAEFARVFFRMMACPFNLSDDNNPFVKRACLFYNTVVNEIDEGEPFPTKFQRTTIRCCLKHICQERKHTRERIVEVIIQILRKIGKDNIGNIPHDTALKIQNFFLNWLQDKNPKVRALCAGGLQYFAPIVYEQDVGIFEDLEHVLRYDPSHEVRRSALLSMRFCPENAHLLYEKVIDLHEVVRLMAFDVIKRDSLLDCLSLVIREAIIEAGLSDEKVSVRTAVIDVMKDFLENKCGNDIVKFLGRFDSYGRKRLCFKMLDMLIPNNSSVAKYDTSILVNGLVPYDKFSDESLFFWAYLVARYPSAIKIPNVNEMCKYMIEYKRQVEEESIETSYVYLNMLFTVLELLPVEEGGRVLIRALVREFAGYKHLDVHNTKQLIRLLYHSAPPNREEFVAQTLQQFLDSFGTVKQPIQPSEIIVTPERTPTVTRNTQEELTKLKAEVGFLVIQKHRKQDLMTTASQNLDFTKAQTLKVELDELLQQIESLKSQVSRIEQEYLVSAPLNDSTVAESDEEIEDYERSDSVEPTVISLQLAFSTLVHHLKLSNEKPSSFARAFLDLHFNHGVLKNDPDVRKLALEAKTMFGLADFEDAEPTIVTCIQAFYKDPEKEVRITAYKCIIDLLLMYGFNRFGMESIESLISNNESTPISLDTTISLENKIGSGNVTDSTNMLKTLVLANLTSEDDKLLHIAIEGAMKLLLAKRIRSPRIISNLLRMWVNPAYETSQLAKNIGVFIPIYIRQGVTEYSTVINCIPDCVRKIIYAPRNSVFHLTRAKSAEEIIGLVSTFTEQGKLKETFDDPLAPHNVLIGIVLEGIKEHESMEEIEAYIKSLKYLNLENTPLTRAKELIKELRDVQKKIIVPPSLKVSMNSFTRYLEKIEANALAKEVHLDGSLNNSISNTTTTNGNITVVANATHLSQISILDSTKASDSKDHVSESDETSEIDFDD